MNRVYGNLINRIAEDGGPEPVVGGPVTLYYWSDRYAQTVTRIITANRVLLDDGQIVTRRQNGAWRLVGESMRGGTGIRFGVSDPYRDPSF